MKSGQLWQTRNGLHLVEIQDWISSFEGLFVKGRFVADFEGRHSLPGIVETSLGPIRHESRNAYIWGAGGEFSADGDSPFDLVSLVH